MCLRLSRLSGSGFRPLRGRRRRRRSKAGLRASVRPVSLAPGLEGFFRRSFQPFLTPLRRGRRPFRSQTPPRTPRERHAARLFGRRELKRSRMTSRRPPGLGANPLAGFPPPPVDRADSGRLRIWRRNENMSRTLSPRGCFFGTGRGRPPSRSRRRCGLQFQRKDAKTQRGRGGQEEVPDSYPQRSCIR